MENWRKFTNEGKKKKTAIIDTVRGDEEVDISYELGNFFIYKTTNRSKSHYFVTHKPSGKMIPSSYYAEKYGYKYADLKRMLKDIDSMPDSAELSKEEPNMEALKSLVRLLTSKESMNEAASKETADSFIERYVYELYNKHTTHITVVTSDMSEQHAIFGSGAYRISSREMWRELKENEVVVNKSLDDFSEKKPRIRIPLSNEILEEFEKIRRGNQKKD